MREIKFRAWHKERQKMLSVFDINFRTPATVQVLNDKYELYNELFDCVEIMQFTGLKDVNGVDIYEGDILSSPHFDNKVLTHMVIWSDRYNGWFLDNLSSNEIYSEGSVQMWVAMKSGSYKVIGNIHQNPELLERCK